MIPFRRILTSLSAHRAPASLRASAPAEARELPPGGDPAIQARIDAILQDVTDPESGLPIAELGLVRRVRVAEAAGVVYLDVPFDEHAPGCMACVGLAMPIIMGIRRDLTSAFQAGFPGYRIEFM